MSTDRQYVSFGLGPDIDRYARRALRRPGELGRLWRWTRRHHWSAKVVIITGAVAVAYIAAVIGVLVGAGLAP